MISALNKLLEPLRTRVANMVARSVVTLVQDSLMMQGVQLSILDGETREAERFQEYGFSSAPMPGAEAVVVFAGGRRDHGLVVAVDDRRYRKKGLQPGEVAVYHKDGAAIVMKSDGSVEVTAKPGENIVLNGGTEKVSRVGDATAGHTHTISWVQGGDKTVTAITAATATDTMAEGAEHVKA